MATRPTADTDPFLSALRAQALDETPRLIPGLGAGLHGVFSRTALDELLWRDGDSLRDDCTLTVAGRREHFPRRAGYRLREWAMEGFVAGASVLIEQLHWHEPAVAVLASRLEHCLDAAVDVVAVLTPSSAQTFPWHRDADDVLVLQLQGSKHWQWQPNPLPAPCTAALVADADVPARPLSAVLQPGDGLYLPHGTSHRAWTEHSPSLHLTVPIRIYRWLDLMQDLIAAISLEEVNLRRRAEPGQGAASAAALRALARKALAGAADQRARRAIRNAPPLPGGALVDWNGPDPRASEESVRKIPGSRCRLRPIGGAALLDFAGHRGASLSAPLFTLPALEFIAAQEGSFRARDLPDVLTHSERTLLVERLLRDGLLERAP